MLYFEYQSKENRAFRCFGTPGIGAGPRGWGHLLHLSYVLSFFSSKKKKKKKKI